MYSDYGENKLIEDEIKNEFNKNNKNRSNGLFLILGLLIFFLILFRLYSRYQHNKYIGDSKVIPFVEFNWENVSISEVTVVKIPDNVYDSIWSDSEWSEFLFWDKKNILFVYWDGCPYASAYENSISKTFSDKSFLNNYYSKNIFKVPQSYTVSCHNPNCPRFWLWRVCSASFCIINPKAKEVIVDKSQNSLQIPVLLDAYYLWEEKTLFE